jgi:hypothetical protein
LIHKAKSPIIRLQKRDFLSPIPNQEGFKNAGMIALHVSNKDKVPRGRIEWANFEIGGMGQEPFPKACLQASDRAYLHTYLLRR